MCSHQSACKVLIENGMKPLLRLIAFVALLFFSGCVIKEDRGGGYDPYYHGYGHDEHWDRDHWR